MSDEEIICEFMEPRPEWPICVRSAGGWWLSDYRPILNHCDPLAVLGYLREVEERLTADQRSEYVRLLCGIPLNIWTCGSGQYIQPWALVNASAETKIRALAQVLKASHA